MRFLLMSLMAIAVSTAAMAEIKNSMEKLDLTLTTDSHMKDLGKIDIRTNGDGTIEVTKTFMPEFKCPSGSGNRRTVCDPPGPMRYHYIVVPTLVEDRRAADGSLLIKLGDNYTLSVSNSRMEQGTVYSISDKDGHSARLYPRAFVTPETYDSLDSNDKVITCRGSKSPETGYKIVVSPLEKNRSRLTISLNKDNEIVTRSLETQYSEYVSEHGAPITITGPSAELKVFFVNPQDIAGQGGQSYPNGTFNGAFNGAILKELQLDCTR